VIAGITITRQVTYDGLVDGLSIGLLALGIVLIYRSSRVINFAVGGLGAFSASLLALLTIQYNWNFWPAAIVSVAGGAAFAAACELTVITRLFRAPRVILLVATIGIAQVAQAAQVSLPHIDDANLNNPYPTAISGTWTIAGIRVTGPTLQVLIAVPLIALALTWFLTRSDTGKAVRAAAANPERARLSAINPKLLSTLVWTIAGVLSAVSLILLAGTTGSAVGLTTIGANTLSRVLAAALLARMVSFPRALMWGIVIGIAQALIKYNTPEQTGVFDMLLFIVVLVATWLIARSSGADEDASFSFAPRTKPVPERLRQVLWVRALPWLLAVLGLAVAVAVPLVVSAPSRHFLYARILLFAVIALSLVVLTGWAGQVSLGQAAFAGLGALGYAALVNGNPMGIGYGTHRINWDVPKLPPILALVVMTVVCAIVAALIGAGALRVRGLLLAIVTFTFALACQQYVFQRPFLSGGIGGSVFAERPKIAGIDFASQRAFYYVSLAGLALTMLVVARLRRSGIGRAMIGVRDNADSAAAYTISPARAKLQSFALAGAIAGFGGALLGGLLSTISVGEVFTVSDSLQVLSIAVIGGVGSVAGPILGALWVIGLPAFWPNSDLVPLLTGGFGLLILLMYFPGGLVQVGYSIRDALFAWLDRRLPETVAAPKPVAVPRAREREVHAEEHGDVLVTSGVTVRFGGRVAVDDVAIRVAAREVVGLIGTNGAGKTTLMNAIGGYVPSSGHVELLGRDVTRFKSERRARLGLGRTFQAARLFGDLTVRETLQVALEGRHRTGFTSTALFLPKGFRADRRQRADAEEIIAFLGLGPYAERFCAELSTGTRRIVELGALLALDARILCLDEPTAGIAQRETEAFGPLLLRIREELDASLVVIEHDMPLIMSISDRVYCLEAGRVIAEGSPSECRENPIVIASYLGTDQRAIRRSGAAPVATGAPKGDV
jgi:ABC-type branched-subunit amino acid transport system ATPase component/ABC-type branched-subunit amino acid transport system permease subunit